MEAHLANGLQWTFRFQIQRRFVIIYQVFILVSPNTWSTTLYAFSCTGDYANNHHLKQLFSVEYDPHITTSPAPNPSFAEGNRMVVQIADKKHVWSKYANTAGVTCGLNVMCSMTWRVWFSKFCRTSWHVLYTAPNIPW